MLNYRQTIHQKEDNNIRQKGIGEERKDNVLKVRGEVRGG